MTSDDLADLQALCDAAVAFAQAAGGEAILHVGPDELTIHRRGKGPVRLRHADGTWHVLQGVLRGAMAPAGALQ
jgi:hypothetical protein